MASFNLSTSSCFASVNHKVDQFLDWGTHTSRRLDKVKLFTKTAQVTLKCAELIPVISGIVPFSLLTPVLKDMKRLCNFFMGFRSFKFFKNIPKNVSKLDVLLNVAGVTLFFCTIVDILDRLKFNVKRVHAIFNKVPFFNVLPFAGLLNLSTVTLLGILFWKSLLRDKIVRQKNSKLQNKIKACAQLQDIIENKIKKYQTKNESAEKLKNLILVSNYSCEKRQIFHQRVITRLNLKANKTQLELTSSRLSLISGAIKIAAVVLGTFFALSGVGLAVSASIFLGLGIIEVGCDLSNYFLKKKLAVKKIDDLDFIVL